MQLAFWQQRPPVDTLGACKSEAIPGDFIGPFEKYITRIPFSSNGTGYPRFLASCVVWVSSRVSISCCPSIYFSRWSVTFRIVTSASRRIRRHTLSGLGCGQNEGSICGILSLGRAAPCSSYGVSCNTVAAGEVFLPCVIQLLDKRRAVPRTGFLMAVHLCLPAMEVTGWGFLTARPFGTCRPRSDASTPYQFVKGYPPRTIASSISPGSPRHAFYSAAPLYGRLILTMLPPSGRDCRRIARSVLESH